jgi:hypothetical protein
MQDKAHRNYYQRHDALCKQRALNYYYAHIEERKQKMTQWCNAHKQIKADYDRRYYDNHAAEIKARGNKWKRSNPGCYAKRRNLGKKLLHLNPFDLTEKVVCHHIDDIYMVYLPEDLHSLYNGPNKEHHRECLQYIVNQIYGGETYSTL